MPATQPTWIHLSAPPSSVTIPNGMDANFIATEYWSNTINCIYKYHTHTDKWNEVDGCNDIQNISSFSAALDTKKQMLFLSNKTRIAQIQLNNGNISFDKYNNIETIQTIIHHPAAKAL